MLTDIEKQIIVGTVLGDSSIRKGKTDKYNFMTCQHGPKQKEYAEWKAEILGNGALTTTVKSYKRKTPNKKTGKFYSIVAMRICNNILLDEFRNMFYVNNVKVIKESLLEKYYTPLAMAVHYMDDGHVVKERGTFSIATCGFSRECVKTLRIFLLKKYDLDTNHTHDNRLTIRKKSQEDFKNLIAPYITLESMKYKLVS